jgi:hypothetical protein
MSGFFSLEAAKQEMKITEAVESQIETARQDYQADHSVLGLRIMQNELETCGTSWTT